MQTLGIFMRYFEVSYWTKTRQGLSADHYIIRQKEFDSPSPPFNTFRFAQLVLILS